MAWESRALRQPRRSGRDDGAGQDRGCHLDRRAQVNQELDCEISYQDAPNQNRQPIFFGMKSRAGQDKDSGLFLSVADTYANLHDLNPVA